MKMGIGVHPTPYEGAQRDQEGEKEGPKHLKKNTAEEPPSPRNLRWGKWRREGDILFLKQQLY